MIRVLNILLALLGVDKYRLIFPKWKAALPFWKDITPKQA